MKTNIAAEQKRMEREYTRLCQCYSNFTVLKRSMGELADRAATDPVAAEKLSDLKTLIPNGILGLEREAKKDIKALNAALKQLQSRIKSIGNNS